MQVSQEKRTSDNPVLRGYESAGQETTRDHPCSDQGGGIPGQSPSGDRLSMPPSTSHPKTKETLAGSIQRGFTHDARMLAKLPAGEFGSVDAALCWGYQTVKSTRAMLHLLTLAGLLESRRVGHNFVWRKVSLAC